MSGDVQPRKRKDKRRKKEDELPRSLSEDADDVPAPASKSTSHGHGHGAGDRGENIHVQHDHGVGGGFFVKIIFFAMLAVILGLVGFIFLELRGSTDIDVPAAEDSRFAEYFTGWLDESPDDHGGHDDHAAVSGEDHDSGTHSEEEDHDNEDEEDHSEAEEEGNSEKESATDENDSGDIEEEPSAEPDDSQIVESDEDEEEDDDNDNQSAEDEDEDDDNDNQSDEDEEEDDDNDNQSAENEEEDNDETDEEDDGQSNDDEEDDKENDNQSDDEEEEDRVESDDEENANTAEEEISEEEDGSVQVDDDNDEDFTQEDDSDEKISEPDTSMGDNSGIDTEVNDVDNSKSVNDETDNGSVDQQIVHKDKSLKKKTHKIFGLKKVISIDRISAFGKKKKPSEEIEVIEESVEALKEEEEAVKLEKLSPFDDVTDVEDIRDAKLKKKKERELMRKLEKLLKDNKVEATEEDKEGNAEDHAQEELQDTGGVALKLIVGVALIIVAHMVIVRRWRSLTYHDVGEETENISGENVVETADILPEAEKLPEPIISRRQTLVSEKVTLTSSNLEPEELSEDELPTVKRRTSMDVKRERMDPTKYYTKEELGDSEDFEDEEELVEEEELLEEEYVEEEEEIENSQTQSELGEDELEEELLEEEQEEEEEEEEPLPTPPPAQRPVPPPRRGPQGVDEDDLINEFLVEKSTESAENERLQPESKLKEDEDDWLFRHELDLADEQFANNEQLALETYTSILARGPGSLRAAIGRARSLDKLAERKKSNAHLGDAIAAYQRLLSSNGSRLDDDQFRQLLARCVDRMRFAGRNLDAAQIEQLGAARFPDEVTHMNAMAVSYLLAGRNELAQNVLEKTLRKWPQDGFALVHQGFVLKTAGQLEKGAQLLERGLRTGQPGTMDGRFIFHLGDALHRLGRSDEAMKWYETGVSNGLFMSKYQRSLYNVNRLKAQPWWSLQETTYIDFFRRLERNWKKIREEGLALLRAREASLFQDETESLKDSGDWKQLDLLSRGRKQPGCAKAAITCDLISAFAPAGQCTRGQAKFSVMEPGTHVWPHCGPTNCRLRAHLGLVIPDGVYLRVAQTTKSWEEGKVMVFDDSFEHEVWHNGSSVRLVLIVDVWHPELTPTERKTLAPI